MVPRSGIDGSRSESRQVLKRAGAHLFLHLKSVSSQSVSYFAISQSVSYFTVPPRAHPSTGSQSGSATYSSVQFSYFTVPPRGGT